MLLKLCGVSAVRFNWKTSTNPSIAALNQLCQLCLSFLMYIMCRARGCLLRQYYGKLAIPFRNAYGECCYSSDIALRRRLLNES